MVWKSDMFTFSFLVNWQVGKIQELEKKKKNLFISLPVELLESSLKGKPLIYYSFLII